MHFNSHQLDNGFSVLAECNPDNPVAAFGIFVRAGARDERADIGGVSHFLEHMVFKGTPNRTAEQVNLQLDEMGSNSNARTSEDSTIYHAAVLPEFQTPIVELLLDLMRPSLRDNDFQTEKQVILEEILMYEDQPPYGGYERLMADYFGDHPLSQSILGTAASVGQLSPEMMHEYFRSRYSPRNMALVAAGNVDFDELVNVAERVCGGWEMTGSDRIIQPANGRSGFATLLKPQSTQQYILQLAAAPSAENPQRFAAALLALILGDDSGSRMYWRFIDPGRAESAGMANYEYEGTGMLMTYLCCDPDQAQRNLADLLVLQREAMRNGVTARELQLAKCKAVAEILISGERSENRMFGIGSDWLKNREYLPPAEIAEQLQQVTLGEVNQVLTDYSLTDSMTLCVGPVDNLRLPD